MADSREDGSENQESDDGQAANFARSATPPVAGALVSAGIGAMVAGPGGAAIGAVAGSLVTVALEQRRQRASESAEELVSWTAEFSGMSPAELSMWAVHDDERLELLTATVQAALASLDRVKVRTLAHVLADAVDDDAKLDPSVLVTRCLATLEPLHIRVLRVMLVEVPPSGDPIEGERMVEGAWRQSSLEERFPNHGDGIPVIMATLEQQALVDGRGLAGSRSDSTPDHVWHVTAFGINVLGYLAQSASELGMSGTWPERQE